jgi:hypothetical protein
MFVFTVVQAEYGDCFILCYGTGSERRFLLIDGGPSGVYNSFLRPTLVKMKNMDFNLDVVILTHVDNDHVEGLLEYIEELHTAPADLPIPMSLWENSFVTRGISEGASLRAKSEGLGIPINKELKGLGISLNKEYREHLLSVALAKEPITFSNLSLTIVGPLEEDLSNLKKKWEEVQKRVVDRSHNLILRDNSDRSVANLSSIVLFAVADGHSFLLTGDARSDHILEGLGKADLLDSKGCLHVNILKIPHHGSVHDMTKDFLKVVTADIYVISANGKYNDPSFKVLSWIVETAHEQNREVLLYLTNHVEEGDRLLKTYPQDTYKYELRVMDPSMSSEDIFKVT